MTMFFESVRWLWEIYAAIALVYALTGFSVFYVCSSATDSNDLEKRLNKWRVVLNTHWNKT